MSAPKEVWLSSDGILFKSVSINAYRAQVHSEDVRYVLAESVEAETASLRAQLAEARAERDEERKARLRDESEHLGVRHELAEAMAAAPRWVPVGERLPSEQVMVLLHSPHSQRSSVQYGFYGSDGRGRRTEWFVQTTLGWEPVTDTGDPVTHWQPLPAPPQEEERA